MVNNFNLTEIPDWKWDALCAGLDPDFDTSYEGPANRLIERYCNRCPVRRECFDEAVYLRRVERLRPTGIWGGVRWIEGQPEGQKFRERLSRDDRVERAQRDRGQETTELAGDRPRSGSYANNRRWYGRSR